MQIAPSDWGRVLLPQGPLLELLIRPTVIYFFLLACLRLFARRQVSKLGLSDLLILFLLATAVRHGLTGRYTGVGDALIVAATLMFWDWMLNWAAFRSVKARWLVRGKSIQVVRDGSIVEEAARSQRLTHHDILEKVREHGLASIADVREAYIEPDGKFSVIERSS